MTSKKTETWIKKHPDWMLELWIDSNWNHYVKPLGGVRNVN